MSYVATLRMFVRVYELGSMSAAARDQRTSAAVASSRISELEKHLGVRLFNRTTRTLQPTENGRLFYDGALKVLDAIDEAEAAVMDVTQNPRGSLFVAAPLGIGRRFIAPHVPAFKDAYPQIDAAPAPVRPRDRRDGRRARPRLPPRPSRGQHPQGPPRRRLPAPPLRRPRLHRPARHARPTARRWCATGTTA